MFNDAYSYAVTQLYHIQSTISSDTNITKETKRSLSPELADMLLMCRFNWNICNHVDFLYLYHPMYGNCFTFNYNASSDVVKKSGIQGPDTGLIIELFTGNPNIQSEYEFLGDGIILVVHNQSTLPLFNGNRILISAGAETDIKINRNFVSKLGAPFGNCIKDTSSSSQFSSKYFDYIVNQKKLNYQQDYCYLLCLQDKIINACNCVAGIFPSFGNKSMCISFNEVNCLMDVVTRFSGNNTDSDCSQSCPLECDFVEYNIMTSKSKFPNKYYKNLLAKNVKINSSGISFDDIDNAVMRINVFYETMTFTTVQEYPSIDFGTFLSNLGGTLGLYIGISFLSIVELIELIFLLIETCFKYKNKTNVVAINQKL